MQAPKDATDLALVLLAAFWAGTSAVFGGLKDTNQIRDRIILGVAEQQSIPLEERRRMFIWDWMPLKLSLAFISGVLCAVILLLPSLRSGQSGNDEFQTVCRIAAVMPALGAFYQLISFVADALHLRSMLARKSTPTK
jgi:hypothetical protein